MRKLVVALLLSIVPLGAAIAGDNWQQPGRPQVCANVDQVRRDKCRFWLQTVQRPDIRGASCCGEADAFLTDNFESLPNGDVIAIITGEYPDAVSTDEEGNTFTYAAAVHKGSRILIPNAKRNFAKEDAGNTSGHGVVFLRPSDQEVLCYFSPPLI